MSNKRKRTDRAIEGAINPVQPTSYGGIVEDDTFFDSVEEGAADSLRVQELEAALATIEADIRNQIISGFQLHSTGLEMAEWVSEDLWYEFGKVLKTFISSTQWIIGDWLAHGDFRYGDKIYERASKLLGYEPRTLEHYAYVARQITVRTENLTFAHHALVAAKHEDEQRKWLEKAAKNGWSVAELRHQISGKERSVVSLIADKNYRNIMNRIWRNARRGTLDKIKDADLDMMEAWFKELRSKR